MMWNPIRRSVDAVVVWIVLGLLAIPALGQSQGLPPAIHVAEHGQVERHSFPASGGIPFPRGALQEADLAQLGLFDAAGAEVPVQYRINGRWTDGSIRWLQVDLLSSQGAGETTAFSMRRLDRPRMGQSDLARATDAGIEVDTGAMRVQFGGQATRIEVLDNGAWRRVVDGPIRSHIAVADRATGQVTDYVLDLRHAEIEENGPVRTVIKVEGWHRSDASAPQPARHMDFSPTRGWHRTPAAERQGADVPRDGLELWLAADQGVVNTTDRVGQWHDQSGNGHVGKPVWNRGGPFQYFYGLNGLPTVRNREQMCLKLEEPIELAGDFTLVALINLAGDDPQLDRSGDKPFAFLVEAPSTFFSDGQGGYLRIDNISDQSITYKAHKDAAPVTVPLAKPLVPEQPVLLTLTRQGNVWTSTVDGESASVTLTPAQGNPGSLTWDYLLATEPGTWDRKPPSVDNFKGDLAEMLLYRRALSDREREAVIEHLKSKFSLHPDSTRFSPSVIRFTFNRGQAFFTVHHTWMMSVNPLDVTIPRVALDMELAEPMSELLYTTDQGAVARSPLGAERLAVFQEDTAEVHYPPNDEFKPRFRVLSGEAASHHEGQRYSGALGLKGERSSAGVYLRDMWQMHPKALAYTPASRTLSVEFWPGQFAGPLDLRRTEEIQPKHFQDFMAKDHLIRDTKYSPLIYVPFTLRNSAMGISRTHEVVYDFTPERSADPAALAATFTMPFVPFVTPQWNASTGVMGIHGTPGMFPDIEAINEYMIQMLMSEVEARGWYGEYVYGNVRYTFNTMTGRPYWQNYHPKYAWSSSGPHAMEGGTMLRALWFQYLRTGNPHYYLFAAARGRSIMDTSTIHYHEQEAPGAMVRHGGFDPWVGSRIQFGAHAPLIGLPDHYYITGQPRALETSHFVGQLNRMWNFLKTVERTLDTDISTMAEYYLLTLDQDYYEHALRKVMRYVSGRPTGRGYWPYRIHGIRTFYDVCDDEQVRAQIKDVFGQWIAQQGHGGNLEATALMYAMEPTPQNRLTLEQHLAQEAAPWGGRLEWGHGKLVTTNVFGMMNVFGYTLGLLEEAYQRVPPTPVIRPEGGTYDKPLPVTISSVTPDAEIRYTLDGSTPTAQSTRYRGPVEIARSVTITAAAFKDGQRSDSVSRADFVIDAMPVPREALLAWLRADAGITVEDGRVAFWADQSGNGSHVFQANENHRPDLVANGIGGRPSVQGADGRFFDFVRAVGLDGDCTLVFVALATGQGSLVGDGTEGTVNLPDTSRNYLTIRFARIENAVTVGVSGSQAQMTQPAVWTIVRRDNRVHFYRNGNRLGNAAGQPSEGSTLNITLLLTHRGPSRTPFKGDLSEALFYDRALPDDERNSLEKHLLGRYGLE